MAHIYFNHLNARAFNSFVPEATKAANNEIFEKLVFIGGIALFGWFVYQPFTAPERHNRWAWYG